MKYINGIRVWRANDAEGTIIIIMIIEKQFLLLLSEVKIALF